MGVAVCGNPTAGLGIGFRWENWETLGPLFERERQLTHTLNFNSFLCSGYCSFNQILVA